ncbi:hypothetical protein SRB5_14640 [Streptomyces sp. RB5]|uniref:SGNH hydrolase-type esterase domain-containing protein n=1 Tax=Streptomyces smaragdinus TaxID=2585196 RepID=A0A7K0CD15_9ACTN|nr:SGNH/GDSL hydrolase family protein [Streptomyces smaragdinus]MQY11348.1 hypothetical protein [Streptomyces smaragdinus]
MRRGLRAAAAALAAAALLTAAGCTGDGDSSDARARAGGSPAGEARPSPRPTGPVWDTSPRSIAALGDSITRGFDACGALSDCPEVSWSTGDSSDVNSLAARLKTSPSKTWNLARTGARMQDLSGQLDKAIARRPQLVTILMGANDACRPTTTRMTAVGSYRQLFADALTRLRRELPHTQVYVSSVPDLERLWEVGHNNEMTRQIWSLGICPSMLESPVDFDPRTVDRRARVTDRVRDYNEVLRTECAKHPLCRYDGGASYKFRFSSSHLSKWDYFHPNRSGQGKLAELAYARIRSS